MEHHREGLFLLTFGFNRAPYPVLGVLQLCKHTRVHTAQTLWGNVPVIIQL